MHGVPGAPAWRAGAARLPTPSVVLVAALGAIVLAAIAGRARPRWAPWSSALAALVLAIALAAACARGPALIVDLPWSTSLGSRLSLALDPLGAALAIFAAALAAPILVYTAGYLPAHLRERGRPPVEQARFCATMLAFVVAMVLLATARDLLVIFAALELTALVSFLLIAFDRDDREARHAAFTALVVTAGSSLVFLAGVLLVSAHAGTTSIDALADPVRRGSIPTAALACLVVGAMAKSAQAPLHFWLPRAMVAPTPVSAYLHSAALVAAGVFVLMRVRPLLALEPAIIDAITALGALSIAIGAAMALVAVELKRILAYSTIAQLGYAMLLIGLGGASGAGGAPFFLVAHGLAKSALFMTAGAVTHATGKTRLDELGGLARRMPVLALASAIAAAGLVGLPLTIGYFKDELLLASASHHGTPSLLLTSLAIAATLAYTLRFWMGIFVGPTTPHVHAAPGLPMIAPIVLLATLVLLGGLITGPLERAFELAGAEVADRAIRLELVYRVAPTKENAAALGAWLAGALLYATRSTWERRLAFVASAGAIVMGPASLGDRLARAARAASNELHRLDVRDVRERIGSVLVPTSALVVLAIAFGRGLSTDLPALELHDAPTAIALALTAGAALVAVRPRDHASVVLLISFVGFSLALVYALSGAPDVALVVVLIETTSTLLFLAVLSHVPRAALERSLARHARVRHAAPMAIVAGATAFIVAWSALGARHEPTVARAYLGLAESAHGHDVVTVILADFRGLDTAGELTVIAMALTGALAIARGHR